MVEASPEGAPAASFLVLRRPRVLLFVSAACRTALEPHLGLLSSASLANMVQPVRTVSWPPR